MEAFLISTGIVAVIFAVLGIATLMGAGASLGF